MYGSQFHSQQALTTISPFTEALKNKQYSKLSNDSKEKKVLAFLLLVLITTLVSSAAFAGPKESQLKGGNGSATGRP